MSKAAAESRDLNSLIGRTSHYHELFRTDPLAAEKYWDGVTADFECSRGYSSAEFTVLSWAADEIVKKFNQEVENLEYAGQEA